MTPSSPRSDGVSSRPRTVQAYSELADAAERNAQRLTALRRAAEHLRTAWAEGHLPASPRSRRAMAELRKQITRAEQLHAQHQATLERLDQIDSAGGPDGWDALILGS